MVNFTYENQGINTYLVYTLQSGEVFDTMSLGMITNNRIPGLAQTLFTQVDSTKYIKYNVSAKVSVQDFFMGVINRKRLLGVFGGIVDAMISAEEYMVDSNTIVLDMNYIFTDVSTCETSLICLPLMEAAGQAPDLAGFFRNIMFTHQFDQTENCDYIAQIINYLNSTPVFSLYDFKNLLENLKAASPYGTYAQPVRQMPVQPPVVQPIQQPIAQPVQQPIAQPVPQPVAQPAQRPVAQAAVKQPAGVGAGKQKAFHEVFGNGPAKPVTPPPAPQPAPPVDLGEEVSLFKLLSHYNKENAAAYKAQKAAKKAAKEQGKAHNAAPTRQQSTAPQSPFAVPGRPAQAQTGFAVPGKKESSSAQSSFAVPGRPTPPPTANPYAVPGSPTAAQPSAQSGAPQAVPSIPVAQPTAMPTQAVQMPMDFGETTVLGGGLNGETTVLSDYQQGTPQLSPHLIREKNNERIDITKPLFRLGKERSYVDYFIGDNSAISRSHANIVRQGDQFFVVDANSTNHTFVNNTMISSSVEHPLAHGDKLRLANEEFLFQLY